MSCANPVSLRKTAIAFLCGACLVLSHAAQAAPRTAPEPERNTSDRLLPPKEQITGVNDRTELLGDLYQRLRKSSDAEDANVVASAIERLWLRSGSETVDLLMARAAKMMEEEDFDIALQLLDAIVEIAPGYSEGWTRRAAVFFVKKNFGKSLDDLRHALAIDPSHYKAIQGLALLMQELGDKKSALKAFRRLLTVHPHLEEARQAEQELSREVEGQGI